MFLICVYTYVVEGILCPVVLVHTDMSYPVDENATHEQDNRTW